MAERTPLPSNHYINTAVWVAALGYFVDIFDMILFSVLRVSSLKDLGLEGEDVLEWGVFILNLQMAGMLIGGILWGVTADRSGRVSVLFGSILVYSVANFANAFVSSVELYALLRFIAGIGLAGELGAGITLVSELMPRATRGYATTIVASVGVSGAVAAGIVGDILPWRVCYGFGGAMGLALLFLRLTVNESGLFREVSSRKVARGRLSSIFLVPRRLLRYIGCILIGLPLWYIAGVLLTFAPELSRALALSSEVSSGKAFLFFSSGYVVGDLSSGLLSQLLKSRKRVILYFLLLSFAFTSLLLTLKGASTSNFYLVLIALGFFQGYWAVFITATAEQFGTNLRGTVSTTVTNFVRGATIPLTIIFISLKPTIGIVASSAYVGAGCFASALIALHFSRETFGIDLDYLEE